MPIPIPLKAASLLAKLKVGIDASLYARTFPFRKQEYASRRIVACVFSVGESTEGLALSAVKKQALPVSRIELIKDVSPISRASSMALERARDADYLLWVDADMILFESCTAKLLSLARDNVLYSVAPLLDPVFGRVGYIKLLNMRLVNDLGLRFRDVLGCDKDFCRQAGEKDPGIVVQNYELPRRVLGLHHPTYTAKELFRKNQIERKKRGNVVDPKVLSTLVKLHAGTRSPVLLAGLLGELLPNPDISGGESGPGSGLAGWDRAVELMGGAPEDLVFGFTPDTHPQFRKYLCAG